MAIKVSCIKDKQIVAQEELQVGSLILGREGNLDIIKDETGISREHAQIIILENFLLLKDLNSTNGSWLDDKKAIPEEWIAAQYPCLIQIANVFLTFDQDTNYIPEEIFGALAVFKGDSFFKDFPLNKLGKSLVVGGLGAFIDISNSRAKSDRPVLVIERRAKDLVAYSISKTLPFSVNGENAEDRVSLKNQDRVQIEDYTIYVVIFDKEREIRNQETFNFTSDTSENNDTGSIASLKSWEDSDFDVTDVLTNKMAGRTDTFKKNDPLARQDFNKFENEQRRSNYEALEKKIFLYCSAVCILILIVMFIFFLI